MPDTIHLEPVYPDNTRAGKARQDPCSRRSADRGSIHGLHVAAPCVNEDIASFEAGELVESPPRSAMRGSRQRAAREASSGRSTAASARSGAGASFQNSSEDGSFVSRASSRSTSSKRVSSLPLRHRPRDINMQLLFTDQDMFKLGEVKQFDESGLHMSDCPTAPDVACTDMPARTFSRRAASAESRGHADGAESRHIRGTASDHGIECHHVTKREVSESVGTSWANHLGDHAAASRSGAQRIS